MLEIAREHALRPETLRQRICRLRRHLRTVHISALALFLGLGAALACFEHTRSARSPSAQTVRAFAAYAGTWRVVSWAPSHYAALGLSVVIHDGTARVQGPSGLVERELVFQFQDEKRVTVRAGNAVWDAQLSRTDRAHLRLDSARGFVALERVR